MEKDIKSLLLKYKSLIGLIVLCLVISCVTPRFLSVTNILNVFTQVSVNAIIAVGMCFVILTGGIDLSVGSTLAITGAVAATLAQKNINVVIILIAVLVIGGLIGWFNGILVAKGKIQAFIVTLATMTVFRGITYVYTDGTPISGLGCKFHCNW